ncbi:DUF5719 family protein [Streptosporangium vulgare]|uniref:DUF5719 family protein n=1 Tax=Streptosporangium vulgare TaxID=46190 RepID=UPI0031D06A35
MPAGSVAAVDLSSGIGGQPSALVLTSETPIVAGLVATGTGSKTDVAFTAGAVPIDLGSVVADNRAGGKMESRLLLTAPDAPGAVSVQVVSREGEPGEPFEVEVPASRTKQVTLKKVDGPFAVVVQPRARLGAGLRRACHGGAAQGRAGADRAAARPPPACGRWSRRSPSPPRPSCPEALRP